MNETGVILSLSGTGRDCHIVGPEIESGDWMQIPLTRGKATIIRRSDWGLVAPFTWCARRRPSGYYDAIGYRRGGGRGSKLVLLHRLIMNAPPGVDVDHIDGNTLNNLRSNLRLATRSQNNANQHRRRGGYSQYKGVTFDKNRGLWRAQIKVGGKHIDLGSFRDEIEAARAYDVAALAHFGEFANVNFPDEVGAR